MATDWSEYLVDGMIVDCSTISINYSAYGLATVTFTVYVPKGNVPYDEDGPGFELCIGGVTFFGWVTSMDLSPNSDLDLNEWKVTATAIGCKKGPCNEGC
jgi:hypothetical protein